MESHFTGAGPMHDPTSARATLVLVSIVSFMIAFDAMVVATALAPIRAELRAPIEQLQWTVSAYNLAFALMLLPGAILGDRFGRRRWLLLGLALFVVASVGCALASGIASLIAARALQGIGAGIAMPLAMALLGAAFPREQRARALGVFSGITGFALILGPALGGAIAQGLDWRWVFWVNLPLGLVIGPLLRTRVAESNDPVSSLRLWPLLRGLGALFRSMAFTSSVVSGFLFYASLYGTLFFLPQFLQARGAAPLQAGLQLLPWSATLFITAPLAGRWVARVGERAMVTGGVLLQAAGLASLAWLARADVAYAVLVPALIVAGVGVSAAMPAAQAVALGAVAPAELGRASGVFNALRFLGGVFGVALAVLVFGDAGTGVDTQGFSAGFARAMQAAALLSVLAAGAALGLPSRRSSRLSRTRLTEEGSR
jgi:MFS family permease